MRTVLVTLSCATLATILAACALLTPMLESPPVVVHDPAKVACDAFRKISWYPGDKNEASKVIEDVVRGRRTLNDQTLDFLRDTLGDTDQTIFEAKAHNAAYGALCPDKKPAPSVKLKVTDDGGIVAASREPRQQ